MLGRPRRSLPPAIYALLLAVTLTLGACSKDDFANETMDEVGKLTDEMVSVIKQAKDKKAGVAEARALFDSKQAELGPKMQEVTELRGFQVNEETVTTIANGLLQNATNMSLLQLDLVMDTASDPELDAALTELIAAHTAMLHLD